MIIMSQIIGYKEIVKNMVELSVRKFAEERVEGVNYCWVEAVLENGTKGFCYPTFEAKCRIKNEYFTARGYISELGKVYITSIQIGSEILYGEKFETLKF
jgi:hypothetical protein